MSELVISQQPYLTDKEQEILDQYMAKVEQAKAGEIGAKDVYADLYVLLKSLKELQNEVKDQAIDELERWGRDDTVERNGFTMQVQSRTNYSYKNDPVYVMMDEKRKARQKMMKKAASLNQELYDEATGEIIPPAEISFSTYIKMSKS